MPLKVPHHLSEYDTCRRRSRNHSRDRWLTRLAGAPSLRPASQNGLHPSMRQSMPSSRLHIALRLAALVAVFAVLFAAISTRPKWLRDFDPLFYLTIAYDLEHHGVFSNGIFEKGDRATAVPAPGMFFVPGYPLLVLAAMKTDSRFAAAADCAVQANDNKTEASGCDVYAFPMHIAHAVLLALAVLVIALTAKLIFRDSRVFWLSGLFAAGSFLAETDLFSFIMTESMTIFLYSAFALFAVLAWKTSRVMHAVLAGGVLGLLCLTRPAYVVLIPVLMLFIVLAAKWVAHESKGVWRNLLAFTAACFLGVAPWIVRNHVSVGKWGLTEEYGAVVLIERFAYNDMTWKEFALAFPYCTPGIGDLAFDLYGGTDSMHRFVYNSPGSFFEMGRGRRNMLVQEYGKLDPQIARIVLDEMRTNGWKHLLVSIPLGWCGMWAGWLWSLLLVPLFGWACVRAAQRSQPLL